MADPDLQISGGKGKWGRGEGGGGRKRGGDPEPEIRGGPGLQQFFSALRPSNSI